jgi:hypothetical protein
MLTAFYKITQPTHIVRQKGLKITSKPVMISSTSSIQSIDGVWMIQEIDGSDLVQYEEVFIGMEFRSLAEIGHYSFPLESVKHLLVSQLECCSQNVFDDVLRVWGDIYLTSENQGKALQYLLSKIPRMTVINMCNLSSACIINPRMQESEIEVSSINPLDYTRYERMMQRPNTTLNQSEWRLRRERIELFLNFREGQCNRNGANQYMIDDLEDLCSLEISAIKIRGRLNATSPLGLYLYKHFGEGDWLNIRIRYQVSEQHPFRPPDVELIGPYAPAFNDIVMGNCMETLPIMSANTPLSNHLWSPAMTAAKVFIDTMAEFNASDVVIPHVQFMAHPACKVARRRGLLYIKHHCREIAEKGLLIASSSASGTRDVILHREKMGILFVANLFCSDRVCIPGLICGTISSYL